MVFNKYFFVNAKESFKRTKIKATKNTNIFLPCVKRIVLGNLFQFMYQNLQKRSETGLE